MPARKKATPVPAAYSGNEQAYIKHQLLEAYLKKLFLIIGMSAGKLGVTQLCYIDCFAGPWRNESEDLGGTSISISLRILDECRRELAKRDRVVPIRALYVERDKAAFGRLQQHLLEYTPAGIESTALHGDVVELHQSVLDWCGNQSFAFFFIDPTGWTPVGIKVLKPLLQRSQSEFLITFMYDFINRAASMRDFRKHMEQLLGEVPTLIDLNSNEREKKLLDSYRGNLKQSMRVTRRWPARSAYVRVLDREKQRPKYHLVYLTSHPRGIIEFMEISENLDQVQKRVRALTRQNTRAKKSGMDDLFGVDGFVDAEEGRADLSAVERHWMNYLLKDARPFGADEFANLLEETDWFPGDFQRALGSLINSGKVRNLDSPRKRPKKPLHWEKSERLQLTEDGQ